jgi:hypothetical protein
MGVRQTKQRARRPGVMPRRFNQCNGGRIAARLRSPGGRFPGHFAAHRIGR